MQGTSSSGAPSLVLRGEMFKLGESSAAYKLRWFECYADGTLQWSEQEGVAAKSAISLIDAQIILEPPLKMPEGKKKEEDLARFGLRITPVNAARACSLRMSSDEERRVWAEVLDAVAHPAVPAYASNNSGRIVQLPATQPLGVDLGADPSAPCVTVCAVSPHVAAAGLLVGDVIVSVDNTVLRTMAIASRAFRAACAQPGHMMTMRLAGWNREVRLMKQAGISGLTLCAPEIGTGVLVQSVLRDSAAHAAGLLVGDRILAVNGQRCANRHEAATQAIRGSIQEVLFVVTGVSYGFHLRKDADGRLGLGFAHGPPSRGVQGAIITDVMPNSAAFHAGLRNGDLLTSVDGGLVTDQKTGVRLLTAAARALSGVVWRPRPDVDRDGEAANGAAAGTGLASDGVAASEPGMHGAMAQAYYSHSVLQLQTSPLPPGVSLYEDLTAGVITQHIN